MHAWSYWPVLVLGILGLILVRSDQRVWLLVYFLVGTRVLAALIWVGMPRYRLPIMPFIMVLAAAAVAFGMDWFRRRRSPGETSAESDLASPSDT